MTYMRATKGTITGPAVPGRTGLTLLARIRTASGQLLTRASLTSIAYTVSNLTTGASLGTGSFATSTVYDSLQQTDPRWREDSPGAPGPDGAWGYNWAAELPASLFALSTLAEEDPLAGPATPQRVQCDVLFTPVSGEVFRLIFAWQVLPTYG